jgi:hypothetical protein
MVSYAYDSWKNYVEQKEVDRLNGKAFHAQQF